MNGGEQVAYKLLICENEPLEREFLIQVTKESGLPVEVIGEAENGFEAISCAAENAPDVIFMDIRMPGMTGLEAAAKIKEQFPNVKIVIITAYDEFDYAKEALRIGALEYLLKPVRPEELVTVLKKIIDGLEKEREKALKEQELKKSIKKMKKFFQAGFLAGLLLGVFDDKELLASQADLLGLKQIPKGLLVIVPDVEVSSGGELSCYEVYQLVEELFSTYRDESIVVFLGEQVVVGVNDQQDLKELAEKIRLAAEQRLDYTVTIGIGEAVDGDLHQLFKNIRFSTRLTKFFLGGNRIVSQKEATALLRTTTSYSFEKEEELLEQVRLGKKKEALAVLDELLQEMLAVSRGSLAYCQMQMAEVLVLVYRTAKYAGFIEKKDFHLQYSYLQKLGRCQSVAALRKWCQDLLDELLGSTEEGKTAQEAVRKVMKYIRDNYAKELSLQKIAQQIYLSPDYFSRVFKKEAGCTFAEYLTRVRLEAAKQLLANPYLSVSEVAQRVGYHDPNYFSRVFRKAVGLSPSEYRRVISIQSENSRD